LTTLSANATIWELGKTNNHEQKKDEAMTLDELAVGRTAVIKSVGGEGALRLRLLDMGLIPRTAVTMQKIAPMGDPIEIRVRGYELTLRKEDAKNIELTGGEEP
jgi:ferrous iron transport protein A